MANFYCEYCGKQAPSVSVLVAQPCIKHPDGSNKGKHKLYEGAEKKEYTCKHCGHKANSIANLVAQPCQKHPKGSNKGHHAPAL